MDRMEKILATAIVLSIGLAGILIYGSCSESSEKCERALTGLAVGLVIGAVVGSASRR